MFWVDQSPCLPLMMNLVTLTLRPPTDEAAALVVVPNPTTDTNEMPAIVAPDVLSA